MNDRVRQLREATIPPCDADYELAGHFLHGPLQELWESQHPRDVRHSAGTARWLLERGFENPDLVLAALLHDIAKGYQRRRDRVVYVVSGRVGAVRLVGARSSRFALRQAVARSLDHSAEGARLLEAAGAPARVVDLTLRHHTTDRSDPVLALLQRADAAS